MNKLGDEIISLLGENVYKSGAAFYSSLATLEKGKFLILGLNPGGDPNGKEKEHTILRSLVYFTDRNYNQWYEKWDGEKKFRIQENMKELFRFIGYELREVCSTNLFYERTRSEKELPGILPPVYLEILKKVLQTVDPDVIITFGKRPLYTLLGIFKAENTDFISSGHGKWTIQFARSDFNGRPIKIIGLPHLSVYTLYHREEQLKKIKEFVSSP